MDETAVDESMDVSEVRSAILSEKRPLEDGVESDLANKKARGGSDVRLAVNVKKVAEIVLVLATMGKMRGGRKPTPVEAKMMAEAREKLAEVCKEFAPKDIFPREAFGTIIEDLGLNRVRETKLGIRPPKMSIAEKLQLTKEKMEKSEVFPLHSAVAESPATSNAARMFPSRKSDHAPISSGSFQNHSSMVSNSRTLPYQLPTSQIRPSSTHPARNSTSSPTLQGGKPQLRSDEKSNAKLAGDHRASSTPTWSINSQSLSFTKAGLDKGPTHVRHHMNVFQAPSIDTHKEISKIVEKILQPNIPKQLTWTPPSRDYMNKPLTCQTCKNTINEMDTTLVCDACERGYHLRCLQFNPKAILGDEWQEWHCSKCLAISNGKALPPKYGRVMRNIITPKMSSSSAGVQIQSSDENFNQHLVTANGAQINGTHESGIKKSPEKSQKNSESQKEIKLECKTKGEIKEDKEGDDQNIVKESEICTENEDFSSSSMRDVEWVGGVMNEIDGKTYYGSFCIDGTIYRLQDYALFYRSTGNNLTPNKLQGMWEDKETNKKCVIVTRCFFPDDLPEGVGRPCAPESNEVYESNHETTLAAGLIHGPCEVLPPRKFSEEKAMQTPSLDKSKPLFLCKWFYDEKKRLFRDVTC